MQDIGTSISRSPDSCDAMVLGRYRFLGTAYEYTYRLRGVDDTGDPLTLTAERREPNGARGLLVCFALTAVAFFGTLVVLDSVGPFWLVSAISVFLPGTAAAIVAPVFRNRVPLPFNPLIFSDGYQNFEDLGRVEPLLVALVALGVGVFGLTTTTVLLLAIGIAGVAIFLALRNGDYTETEAQRLRTALPTPLLYYPTYALGIGVISLCSLLAVQMLTQRGYDWAAVFWVICFSAIYSVTVLLEGQGAASSEYFAYETRKEDFVEYNWVRWGIVLCCPLIVVGSVAALGVTALATLNAVDTTSRALVVAILAAISLPIWYLVGGFLFQTVGITAARWLLIRRSRPASASELPETPEKLNASVRIYETGPVGQVGFSTGRHAVICLHRETMEILGDDPEAFAALLAHEDAHASVYNDGLLSTYVPFVATALLTGQNLVYAALDFRARELRADRHAATVVSPEAIARAVKQMDDERERDSEPKLSTGVLFTSLTTFVPITPKEGGGVGRFTTNFGGFTMSNAHPSVEDRVDRLRSTFRNEGDETDPTTRSQQTGAGHIPPDSQPQDDR